MIGPFTIRDRSSSVGAYSTPATHIRNLVVRFAPPGNPLNVALEVLVFLDAIHQMAQPLPRNQHIHDINAGSNAIVQVGNFLGCSSGTR